jgi:hypothetical protein
MTHRLALAAAGALAAAALAGCWGQGSALPAPPDGGRQVVTAAWPLQASAMRHLPPGVIYLLTGSAPPGLQLWAVSAAGGQQQLTHSPPGSGISDFGVSAAGIVLAGAQGGVDNLARWSGHGPVWFHPAGHPGAFVHGQAPDISGDGSIVYETPPPGAGGPGKSFAFWTLRSFTGHPRLLYRHRFDPGDPVFGPHGQLAIVGHKRALIFGHGRLTRRFRTGAALGNPPAWNAHAPALAVDYAHRPATLYYPSGRRLRLPAGWHVLSWNPAGTALLVQMPPQLGSWSPKAPHRVTVIGSTTPHFPVTAARWLSAPAPITP